MLHQPIIKDPEVTAAVVDFRDTVIAIRSHSLAAFYAQADSQERRAAQEAIDQAVADMQSRCDRVGVTLDELFALINLDLRRTGGAASRPTGEFLHALTRGATDAYNAEREAHLALSRAQVELRAATDARIAADRACAGYAADWARQ